MLTALKLGGHRGSLSVGRFVTWLAVGQLVTGWFARQLGSWLSGYIGALAPPHTHP